jgi:hypothetical protein
LVQNERILIVFVIILKLLMQLVIRIEITDSALRWTMSGKGNVQVSPLIPSRRVIAKNKARCDVALTEVVEGA